METLTWVASEAFDLLPFYLLSVSWNEGDATPPAVWSDKTTIDSRLLHIYTVAVSVSHHSDHGAHLYLPSIMVHIYIYLPLRHVESIPDLENASSFKRHPSPRHKTPASPCSY